MDPNTYQIFIRLQTGRHCVLDVTRDTTIAQVKSALTDRQGIPVEYQVLKHHSHYPNDHQTLGHLNIQREDCLTLILRSKRRSNQPVIDTRQRQTAPPKKIPFRPSGTTTQLPVSINHTPYHL